jgi:protein-disulfide isomerase
MTGRESHSIITFMAVLGLAGATVWGLRHDHPRARPPTAVVTAELPAPVEPLSLDGARLRGEPSAGVVVLEFSDFECPFCGVFARSTLPSLVARYINSGKVRFAFRHFPLQGIHPRAVAAAQAADCAAGDGKFWEMHDALFAQPSALGPDDLRGVARTLGLRPTSFDRCLEGSPSASVRNDIAEGVAVAVQSTPTFFVGIAQPDGRIQVTRRLSGALPVERFAASIDHALDRVAQAAEAGKGNVQRR